MLAVGRSYSDLLALASEMNAVVKPSSKRRSTAKRRLPGLSASVPAIISTRWSRSADQEKADKEGWRGAMHRLMSMRAAPRETGRGLGDMVW